MGLAHRSAIANVAIACEPEESFPAMSSTASAIDRLHSFSTPSHGTMPEADHWRECPIPSPQLRAKFWDDVASSGVLGSDAETTRFMSNPPCALPRSAARVGSRAAKAGRNGSWQSRISEQSDFSPASTGSTALTEPFSASSETTLFQTTGVAEDHATNRCWRKLQRRSSNDSMFSFSTRQSRSRTRSPAALPAIVHEKIRTILPRGLGKDTRASGHNIPTVASDDGSTGESPRSRLQDEELKRRFPLRPKPSHRHSEDIARPASKCLHHGPISAPSAASTNIDSSPDSQDTGNRAVDESILATRKRQIVDRVMASFEQMLGYDEMDSEDEYENMCSYAGRLREEGEGSETPSSRPSNHVNSRNQCHDAKRPPGSEASKRESKRQKQGGSEGSDNEDEDEGSRRPHPQSQNVMVWEKSSKRLACPYFRMDPLKPSKHNSCRYPGFSNVSRLKEHLYRQHVLPIICPRCHERFATNRNLTDHLMAPERCPAVEEQLESMLGLNQDQVAQLKKKTRARALMSEAQKWRMVFQIVFPDVEECDIPSPCKFRRTSLIQALCWDRL
ncbi:hypothetical protein B0J12DRAFT_268996 [Macrophomina phaseolina]|uniref:C2H2-type domain-containing protein n=1 Tax=Macrophomina phaseolina TaxID=35725 RepID=A0ABQ8FYL2_9PEZI|nr:hypothetical protein B0J12DRAFT_268996 [Macrophomina phaseolina]